MSQPSATELKAFTAGTRVRTTMGIPKQGVIAEPFHYSQSTDGTNRLFPPKGTYLPVEWSDGTKGYAYAWHITQTA